MKKYKIGFIGCGNMGEAMLTGFLASKKLNNHDICLNTFTEARKTHLINTYQIIGLENNIEVAKHAHIIIIGTKPNKYQDVLTEIKTYLSNDQIIVSITPSYTTNELAELVNHQASVVRTLPNTSSRYQAGFTGISFSKDETESNKSIIKSLFLLLGKIMIIDESQMPILSTMTGSSPALIYLISKQFIDYGKQNGFSDEASKMMFTETLKGSLQMMINSKDTMQTLINQVCSPSGSTIEGVNSLLENDFEKIMLEALEKITAKFKHMMLNK